MNTRSWWKRKRGLGQLFFLGIITEETNLGDNLGSGNWRVDMHPTRDQPLFAKITADLGFNPDTMPVSKKPWYGWGGAMGPAQFIPSTWICFAGYTNTTTGKCSKNPNGSWQGPWEYNVKSDRIGKRTGSSPLIHGNPKMRLWRPVFFLWTMGPIKEHIRQNSAPLCVIWLVALMLKRQVSSSTVGIL